MKKKIVLLSISILLIISLIFINSKPKETIYVNEDNVEELMKNTLAVYTENSNGSYDKSTTIPGINDGYTFDYDKSMCEGTATISWNNESWGAEISNVNKEDTKCYLYFRVKTKQVNTVLGNITVNYERPDFSKTATTDEGIHMALDDDGESYYYRGAVDNNWVRFAGFYWRIIRINGNGSLRIIYSGVDSGSITDDNRTGEGTQIGTSAFNENYNDNAYVGYMYGTPGSSTYEETHANVNDSTIKTYIDNWYTNNLTSYESYLDINSGFCGDRTAYSDDEGLISGNGYGKLYTRYISGVKLINNLNPSFLCKNNKDFYTIVGAIKGNKSLSNSIALITYDEVVYGGANRFDENLQFYLYSGQDYSTISPSSTAANGVAYQIIVSQIGALDRTSNWLYVGNEVGVRPVINLRSDIAITGSGTSTDPYVVS